MKHKFLAVLTVAGVLGITGTAFAKTDININIIKEIISFQQVEPMHKPLPPKPIAYAPKPPHHHVPPMPPRFRPIAKAPEPPHHFSHDVPPPPMPPKSHDMRKPPMPPKDDRRPPHSPDRRPPEPPRHK